MPLRWTVSLLVLCPMAALAQTAPGPSMLGSSPGIALRQPGNAELSCRLCAAPTEPGALDGTNRKAIDNAVRSLGSKLLPGVGASQPPSSGKPVPDPKLVPSPGNVNERIITRNSRCSIPLLEMRVDPDPDPRMVLPPLAAGAAMPQVHVPAPPCDEPAARDLRLVIPPRR